MVYDRVVQNTARWVSFLALVMTSMWASAAPPPPPSPPPPPATVQLPVIEVLDPSGAITAPFVRAAILKIQRQLLACSEESRWRSSALVWLVTDWRGKVSKLELAVDSAGVEKCLATALRTVVVQNAQVRATAFVKIAIGADPDEVLAPKAVPTPSTPTAPTKPTTPSTPTTPTPTKP